MSCEAMASAVMERLRIDGAAEWSAADGAIHLTRYLAARAACAGRTVLDAACGEGYGAYLMAERWGAAEVHGVDVSTEAIEHACRLFRSPRVAFHRGDVDELGALFTPGRFDLVVSLETIEHLEHPVEFLQALKRVVRPDGGVLISCPNDHWYYRDPMQSNPFHRRKYTFTEFRQMCESVLGPARAFLMGTPVAGYVNWPPEEGMLGNGAPDGRAILRGREMPSVLLPTAEQVMWENCSYFLGVWGDVEVQALGGASVFATAMGSSEVAVRQVQVEQLRDANTSLEQRVAEVRQTARAELERLERHSGLRIAAFRAENDLLRQELGRHRDTIDALTREAVLLRAAIGFRPAVRHLVRRTIGERGTRALRRLWA